MKLRRTLMATAMLTACAVLGSAQGNERSPAPPMDALTAARTADISPFWTEIETPAAIRMFSAIGAALGH